MGIDKELSTSEAMVIVISIAIVIIIVAIYFPRKHKR